MYPAVRTLVRRIESAGATPIFFLAWGHRDGSLVYGLKDYQTMQFQIDIGTWELPRNYQSPLLRLVMPGCWQESKIPCSIYRSKMVVTLPEIGTYFVACVFYAVIFRETPIGLSYQGHLDNETAQLLQQVADSTVLDETAQWNYAKSISIILMTE